MDTWFETTGGTVRGAVVDDPDADARHIWETIP
jgi:hypothetical protein